MSGYLTMGLILLFVPLAWVGYRIWSLLKIKKEKRVRIGLHDKQIKELTMIVRLRDFAFILTLFEMSMFCFINVSISSVPIGSKEYVFHNNLSEFSVVIIFTTFAFALILSVIKRVQNDKLMKTIKLQMALQRVKSKFRRKMRR